MSPGSPPVLERSTVRHALAIGAVLFGLAALVALGISFQLSMAATVRQANQEERLPPFAYSAAVYPVTPLRDCVNIGDTMHFTSTLNINAVPVVVTRYRTIWNVAQQRTVWSDPDMPYAIWTEPTQIVNPVIFTVPHVPAGLNEIRVAGKSDGRDISVYIEPLNVCGGV